MAQSAETTAAPPVEQEKRLTIESVRAKIKHMIANLMSEGVHSGVFTIDQIKDNHSFSNELNLTIYEKRRLVFQCDEYYGINLGPEAEGTAHVGDFINMVFNEIQSKNNTNSTQTEQATTAEQE